MASIKKFPFTDFKDIGNIDEYNRCVSGMRSKNIFIV